MIAVLPVWRAEETLPTASLSVALAAPTDATVLEARSPRSEPQNRGAKQLGGVHRGRQLSAQAAWSHRQKATCMINVDPGALPNKSVEQTGAVSL